VARKISRKHEFWISDYAYLELKNFCLRYGEFKDEISVILNSTACMPTAARDDPTADTALRIERLSRKRELIEQTAIEADSAIYQALINNVTTGVSYEQMRACGIRIPCGQRQFYKKRRKFFWLLNYKKG